MIDRQIYGFGKRETEGERENFFDPPPPPEKRQGSYLYNPGEEGGGGFLLAYNVMFILHVYRSLIREASMQIYIRNSWNLELREVIKVIRPFCIGTAENFRKTHIPSTHNMI